MHLGFGGEGEQGGRRLVFVDGNTPGVGPICESVQGELHSVGSGRDMLFSAPKYQIIGVQGGMDTLWELCSQVVDEEDEERPRLIL